MQIDSPDAVVEPRKPFWVKCGSCQHVWAAAYFPMDASRMAKVAKQCCPYCGHAYPVNTHKR